MQRPFASQDVGVTGLAYSPRVAGIRDVVWTRGRPE
jgi:hypothetical protein